MYREYSAQMEGELKLIWPIKKIWRLNNISICAIHSVPSYVSRLLFSRIRELYINFNVFQIYLEDERNCIRGCEEFKYLGVKVDEEDRQENDIMNRINKGRAITSIHIRNNIKKRIN